MIGPLTEQQIRRYARHLVLGAVGMRGQRALLAAEIAIEVDSAAAHVAVAYLAAAGVGRIAVGGDPDAPIDAREIAGAPLLLAADAGRPRLAAIAERVAALNPDVEIVAAEPGEVERDVDVEPTNDPIDALIAGGQAAARTIAALCRQEEP